MITFLGYKSSGCFFKVKYLDNKVGIGYLIYEDEQRDKESYERFLYNNYFSELSFRGPLKKIYERTGDLYALICAIITDFYICEERESFYESKELPITGKQRKKSKKRELRLLFVFNIYVDLKQDI